MKVSYMLIPNKGVIPMKVSSKPSPDKSLVHADQQMYCASDPPMKILSIPSPDEGIIDAAS